MAEDSYRRFYARADFTALVGNTVALPLLISQLTALALSQPIIEVRALPGGDGAAVEWRVRPSDADLLLVDGVIHAFVGGVTSNAPLEAEVLGVTSATVAGALVDVIDVTTPALDAGTYQVLWDSLVAMLAAVANTGVRGVITLSRIRGAASVSRQWEHNWQMPQPQTFSGGITFQCVAGDKIRALLQVGKIGAPAATAQMAMARITIDQI